MPEYAALTFGKIAFLPRMNEEVLLYRRYTEEKSFLIVSNLTNQEQIIQLDKPMKELILNNDVGFELIGKELKLSPFAALVLREEIENGRK